jgi:hypothetical protein
VAQGRRLNRRCGRVLRVACGRRTKSSHDRSTHEERKPASLVNCPAVPGPVAGAPIPVKTPRITHIDALCRALPLGTYCTPFPPFTTFHHHRACDLMWCCQGRGPGGGGARALTKRGGRRQGPRVAVGSHAQNELGGGCAPRQPQVHGTGHTVLGRLAVLERGVGPRDHLPRPCVAHVRMCVQGKGVDRSSRVAAFVAPPVTPSSAV